MPFVGLSLRLVDTGTRSQRAPRGTLPLVPLTWLPVQFSGSPHAFVLASRSAISLFLVIAQIRDKSPHPLYSPWFLFPSMATSMNEDMKRHTLTVYRLTPYPWSPISHSSTSGHLSCQFNPFLTMVSWVTVHVSCTLVSQFLLVACLTGTSTSKSVSFGIDLKEAYISSVSSESHSHEPNRTEEFLSFPIFSGYRQKWFKHRLDDQVV